MIYFTFTFNSIVNEDDLIIPYIILEEEQEEIKDVCLSLLNIHNISHTEKSLIHLQDKVSEEVQIQLKTSLVGSFIENNEEDIKDFIVFANTKQNNINEYLIICKFNSEEELITLKKENNVITYFNIY